MRQAFRHWPGVPLIDAARSTEASVIEWCSWPKSACASRSLSLDGMNLRENELALSTLIHRHREHLEKVLPDADDWLLRASNCLELLKDFLYKPPSERPGWSQTIDRMEIPVRWKRKIFELAVRWPKLKTVLWYLAFLELSNTAPCGFHGLGWLEDHAESICGLMSRHDGVQVAILLSRVGPDIDPRWLSTIFEFLSDPSLGQTECLARFTRADDLAQTLRNRLNNQPTDVPEQRVALTLADKIVAQLASYVAMKRGSIRKVTGLLGALVDKDLSHLVRALNRRAQAEERRLTKELLKLEQLGVHYYVEAIGTHHAQARAHVVTNLRQESLAVTTFFDFSQRLCEETHSHDQLCAATELFERANCLRVANRIYLAVQWHAEDWAEVNKFLPVINELLARRGIHAQLTKHWLHQTLPSVSQQKEDVELVQTGLRYADSAGWRKAIQLLECLVYGQGERLTETTVTALIKLAQAAPGLNAAHSIWRSLPAELLARADLAALQLAIWLTSDGEDLRMTLAWLSQHLYMVAQVSKLKATFTTTEYQWTLRRLLQKRDLASLEHWSENAELLESFGIKVPEEIQTSADTAWTQAYPVAFQEVLARLAGICDKAEKVAFSVIGGFYPSAAQLNAEIDSLEVLLANAIQHGQSATKCERIVKRIDNLKRELVTPRAISPARQMRLVDKLSTRVEQAVLESVSTLARDTLQRQLGAMPTEDLCQRLARPPYNRILPALAKLPADHQKLAWRALAASWDNSLKLLSEPANQKFLKQMNQRGLNLEAWLSSEFSTPGSRADGTTYRVAFTQDPLDILLMGHHFSTCLAPESFNFYSTVSNLVDANKRVVYGRSHDGELIGRCLFALTNQGHIQTFNRYQRCSEDGFPEAIDRFAAKLAAAMKTSLTESGQVSCLVARRWYDDGCMPVPSSERGKSARLSSLIEAQPDVQPLQLAMEVFDTEEAIVRAANTMYEYGLFYEVRTVNSLFPLLVCERPVPLSLRLRLAARVWFGGNLDLARTVFVGLTNREIYRSLGRETLRDLIEERGFAELMTDRDPYLARRMLRASRPNYVRSDEQEESKMRQAMRDHISVVISCQR